LEKYELPIPPGTRHDQLPGNSSRPIQLDNLFDRTYLKPLFLQVQCPSCQQKFRLDSRELEGTLPEFECLCCQTQFRMEVPIKNPSQVRTIEMEGSKTDRMIAESMRSALRRKSNLALDVKKCPKCSCLNPRSLTECMRCGIIFSRLEGLPLDRQVGAIPSLVRAWGDLVGDYQNLRKHFEFVDRCEDLNAVPYALKKYEDFKSVQPQDPIAQSMIQRVIIKQFSKMNDRHRNWLDQVRAWPWRRILKLGPVSVSALVAITGLVFPNLRNLVGVGVGAAIVTVGFVVFTHGRFDPKDFWAD